MAKYTVGSVYYINQGTEPFASISMGGSTVKSIGCAVCAFAMLICHKEGYASETDAVQVVKDIIKQCVDTTADDGGTHFYGNDSIILNGNSKG